MLETFLFKMKKLFIYFIHIFFELVDKQNMFNGSFKNFMLEKIALAWLHI